LSIYKSQHFEFLYKEDHDLSFIFTNNSFEEFDDGCSISELASIAWDIAEAISPFVALSGKKKIGSSDIYHPQSVWYIVTILYSFLVL
jgi:hypothetical protein